MKAQHQKNIRAAIVKGLSTTHLCGYFENFLHIYCSTSTDPDKPITAAEAASRQNVRFAAV